MSMFDPSLPPVLNAPFTSFRDWRGSLTKVFAEGELTAPGFEMEKRQILHSATAEAGILRGMHAQLGPHSEGKILISLSGHMFWVVVDLREGSNSFGVWKGFDLTPEGSGGASGLQVPAGFAHGCLSVSPDANLMILADKDFAPDQGVGIAWDDKDLAIEWPLNGMKPRLSDDHASYGSFADFREQHGSL
mgnify:CR=1 FL=1